MNQLRNMKDILSIPTGSRNMSNYSNLTDSQYFFGSQFWPENSQGSSQTMSLSARNSQQSSQEGSEPHCSYHSKPLLFGDMRDKNKTSGLLDEFEEARKNAKEKIQSELLTKECHHIRETLKNIQQLLAETDRNADMCQPVLQKIDTFSFKLQDNLSNLQSEMSQQFQTVTNEINSQKGVITEMDQRVKKNGDVTAELDSQMQTLKTTLECLKEEQNREQGMLEEALKHLSTLVLLCTAKRSTEPMMDSAIQTSPALQQSALSILQESRLEGTQLPCALKNLQENQSQVPRHHRSRIVRKKKSTKSIRRNFKRCPPMISQRKRVTASDENSPPLANQKKQRRNVETSQQSLTPDDLFQLNTETSSREATGCTKTPLTCWLQGSDNLAVRKVETILQELSAESNTTIMETPANFWELFDKNDCDEDFSEI